MDKHSHRIAAIGTGPSGVALLAAIMECAYTNPATPPIEVRLYERTGRAGPGLPFGPGSHILRCNQRANTMGVSASNPADFDYWMQRGLVSPGPIDQRTEQETFLHPPRELFGRYLADTVGELTARAEERGHRVEVIHDEVVDLRETTGVELTRATGRVDGVDQAVLCLGNLCPSSHLNLVGSQGYHHNAFPVQRIAATVEPTEHVYVLGTSLSAVDVANDLVEHGHRGSITLVSREGRLARVLSPALPYELRFITPANLARAREQSPTGHLPLASLYSLLLQELAAAYAVPPSAIDWHELFRSPRDPSQALADDLTAARHPQLYQSVLRATTPLVDAVYGQLSAEDQVRCCRATAWMVNRHSMAVPTARRLLELMNTGQVEVIGGLVSSHVDEFRRAPVLRFTRGSSLDSARHPTTTRDSDGTVLVCPSALVNATGSGTDVVSLVNRGLAGRLLASLHANHQIAPHPAGGIRVDTSTWNTINVRGEISRRIYALGHLTKGCVFYCSGMDRIASLAKGVAAVLEQRYPTSAT